MKLRIIFFLSVLFTALLAAQTAPEVEITAEPNHRVVLENKYVRVFKFELAPKASTLMHHHGHDYVLVALSDGEFSNEVKGKPPVTVKLKNGEVKFSPGGFSHIARNLGTAPAINLAIELMKDEEAHKNPPPKWDEERGLNLLAGGTQDILFVKDGVRVTESQLQPGAVIPKHRHDVPHLLVALGDLNLQSEVEGKAPSTRHLKAGEVAWINGGYSHILQNIGTQEAHYVALEFK